MSDHPKMKGKAVELITSPDDPEGGFLIREDERTRVPSSVSSTGAPFAFTSLEPVLAAPVDPSAASVPLTPASPETERNLFRNDAGRIRDE